MFYPKLKFQQLHGRPTFYSNFVSTLDGKVAVKKASYWPIGSRKDYEVLLELRGHADALIHGKTTASSFPTVGSLAKPEFGALRKKIGKRQPLLYIVVSASPDARLIANLRNEKGVRPLLATTAAARLPKGAEKAVQVVRLGKKRVSLRALAKYLAGRGVKHALLEGGPNLLGSFLGADLVDEVFLTLAPKIFGAAAGKTLTMAEGVLLSPQRVKHFKLVSMQKAGDEVFLRYRASASSPLKRGG